MPRKKSSRRWLAEHFSDTYVKQAQQSGHRSRAVYKLLELQQRDALFKPGMFVIDLGAAPGSWSEAVKQYVGARGRVIAVDILPMQAIAGVECIQGDFSETAVFEQLLQCIADQPVDWVLSDMSPNLTGVDSIDQPRSMGLAELAVDFALQVLAKKSGLLLKVFQGSDFDALLAKIRSHFHTVVIRKPKASRGRSREVYILARDRR